MATIIDSSSDTTDLQSRKFTHVFNWFDQDHDGYITASDLTSMSNRCAELASPSDTKNRDAITSGWAHWHHLLLSSHDKLDRDQFIHIMQTVVTANPADYEIAMTQIVNGVLGALDTDGNGSLSQQEYVRMYEVLGIEPTDSAEAFRRLDRDGSGEISYDELRLAINEYYLSANPNAPGNWLLGPMHGF